MTNDLISRRKLDGMRLAVPDFVNPDQRTKGWNECITYIQQKAPAAKITGDTSDGYHTFNELYHHRAVLFSVIVKAFPDKAWKARKHHDGSVYDGMFIVGIETPDGQATYHYDIDPYWDMFDCSEVEFAPEWDGHTAAQAIERIGKLEPVVHGEWNLKHVGFGHYWECSVCHTNPCIYVTKDTKFCPNCGAKMDQEQIAR